MTLEEKIKHAAELISNSKHLVIFTGAGISTDSGISDFRGPDGIWTRRDKGLPEKKMEVRWCDVDPNEGHRAIVKLQDMGLMKFLISQNIDNLHIKSGIKRELIAEFHGNITLMKCLKCGKEYNNDDVWYEDRRNKVYPDVKIIDITPRCPCGGIIKTTVVNFGEAIPRKELELSFRHSALADVFLVAGSSLTVTPAADMPGLAVQNDAKLIIINHMATPFDNIAHIRFFEGAGEILSGIIKEIEK